MSQLSMSQQNIKKKKMTETNNPSANELSTSNAVVDEIQEDNEELLSENSIHKFKPKYLRVSVRVFKQMLSKTNENGEKIVQDLDTNEKSQAIRQLTELINNVHYFELQKKLWQAYYNIGLKENIWTTSASMADLHKTQSKTYFLPKHLIEQRQKTVVHQLQRTTNELYKFSINLEKDTQQWQPSIDFQLVLQIVTECVIKHQQRLKQAFQKQIEMAELNLKDRRSITKFYDLQPNEEQVCFVTNRNKFIIMNFFSV